MKRKLRPIRHKRPNPKQGETLGAILHHAKLMKKAGADPKSIARSTEARCRLALNSGELK